LNFLRTILQPNALTAGILLLLGFIAAARAAPHPDCTLEAAALRKEQADLPRLEFASPKDRPPYCITLETLIAFAGRAKEHIAQCPNSDYAGAAAAWLKAQPNYRKLFTQNRCKRTL
jgi:hypothetical protein